METRCLGCLDHSPDVKILGNEKATEALLQVEKNLCKRHTDIMTSYLKEKPGSTCEVIQKHIDIAYDFIKDSESWYSFHESTESSGSSIMDLMREDIEDETRKEIETGEELD